VLTAGAPPNSSILPRLDNRTTVTITVHADPVTPGACLSGCPRDPPGGGVDPRAVPPGVVPALVPRGTAGGVFKIAFWANLWADAARRSHGWRPCSPSEQPTSGTGDGGTGDGGSGGTGTGGDAARTAAHVPGHRPRQHATGPSERGARAVDVGDAQFRSGGADAAGATAAPIRTAPRPRPGWCGSSARSAPG
jgi:hypothetical protein